MKARILHNGTQVHVVGWRHPVVDLLLARVSLEWMPGYQPVRGFPYGISVCYSQFRFHIELTPGDLR